MRYIINYFKDMDFVSKLLILLGIIMLLPLLMLIPYPEDHIYALDFIYPALFSMLFGMVFRFKKAKEDRGRFFGRNHEVVVVVGIWIYAFVLGALPFVLSGQLDFINGLFEAVSGWTTTGLSVMELSEVPRIFMFYRSFMQFCGGLGFVLLMLLFASGSSAMELFSAEGHPDKLEPNLRSTAKVMMFIYIGFNIIGIIAYMFFDMPWFDSVFHSMAALSTGGFGMTSASLAAYESMPIEIVTMALMLIGTTNFGILALMLKGQFKKVLKIGELRFLAVIILVAVPTIAFVGVYGIYSNIGDSFRAAFFQIVSGISTTGFSTVDFNAWKPSMQLMIIIMMLIGGGAGSTAGGIKFSRVYAMYKSLVFSIKRRFMPERSVNEEAIYKAEGKVYLTYQSLEEIGRFIIAYIAIYFIGTLMLTFAGIPLDKAMFEFASAIGTAGLSVGITTVGTSSYILVIEMIGMMLGRLEIFIVIVALVSVVNKFLTKLTGRESRL